MRLDSGDLVAQAQWVRQLLDDLGNENTRIVVTSDLDEFAIAALQSAPVDSYGVGTSLVTGSGAPTASMVYKLVSRTDDDGEFVSVAKAAKNKASVGGRKYALRKLNERGTATPGDGRASATAPKTTATTASCCSSSSRTASCCPAGPDPRAWSGPRSGTRTPWPSCPPWSTGCSAARPPSPPSTRRS